MAPLVLIGAGWGRTGTLSLCGALDFLGFPCHHMEKILLDPTQDPDVFLRAKQDPSYRPNWDSVFEHYSAAVDWPAAAFWEDIYNSYPDAKVILTTRNFEDWYRSVSASIRDWPMSSNEEWPERMKKTRWMAREVVKNGALRNYDDKEAMHKQWKEHVERVKSIVPAENLLVFELGQGWEPLCRFLGVPVPQTVQYPHSNKGANFEERMFAVRDVIRSQAGEIDPEKAQAYRSLTELGDASPLILHI